MVIKLNHPCQQGLLPDGFPGQLRRCNQRLDRGINTQHGTQALHSMAQAQPFGFHHPVKHRAAGIAAKAVIEIFGRGDHHRRRFFLMERAQHGHVFTALKQLPPLLLNNGN
ncbi:hypothetical protein Xmau_04562 [Xenorhabdus mauleonii]|uniref:Uncharacterized protein n=1 Tax=Xenorhabdus mauleonii TaxID=351675 RepID=A0A2G0NEF5_9GAMM|nr:hypothetical protein Xmau_04562 [Xenorhabdus mauleonii]